jgi:hypothetical protein
LDGHSYADGCTVGSSIGFHHYLAMTKRRDREFRAGGFVIGFSALQRLITIYLDYVPTCEESLSSLLQTEQSFFLQTET